MQTNEFTESEERNLYTLFPIPTREKHECQPTSFQFDVFDPTRVAIYNPLTVLITANDHFIAACTIDQKKLSCFEIKMLYIVYYVSVSE